MKAAIFNLLDAINRDGLDNSEWGLIEDIESTKEQFGTQIDNNLKGRWLYIYINTDNIYNSLNKRLIFASKKDKKDLKSIWYTTEQTNEYIVLTQL